MIYFRERRRVEAVNSAFVKLRRTVPIENKRGKRVSKVHISFQFQNEKKNGAYDTKTILLTIKRKIRKT